MHYSSSVDPRHLRRFLQRLIACKISRFLILIVTHFAFAVTTCALGRVLVKKYARANVSPFNPYRRPITIFTYPLLRNLYFSHYRPASSHRPLKERVTTEREEEFPPLFFPSEKEKRRNNCNENSISSPNQRSESKRKEEKRGERRKKEKK